MWMQLFSILERSWVPFHHSGFNPGDAARYEQEFRERFSSYNTQSEPSPPSIPPQHLKRRFNVIDSSSEDEENPYDEVDYYLRTKRDKTCTDPCYYWRTDGSAFRNLQKMVRDYLATPSMGCSVEREFSILGRLVTNGWENYFRSYVS